MSSKVSISQKDKEKLRNYHRLEKTKAAWQPNAMQNARLGPRAEKEY